jgi:hypothetical protein
MPADFVEEALIRWHAEADHYAEEQRKREQGS